MRAEASTVFQPLAGVIDDVGSLPEWMIGGQRLRGEDVEAGAADMAAIDRGGERTLVDQFAACGVDENRTAFHGGKFLGVEKADQLRRQPRVQRNHVGFGQQTVEASTAVAPTLRARSASLLRDHDSTRMPIPRRAARDFARLR